MVDALAKQLSLSEAQEVQISELHFAHFKEIKELTKTSRRQRGGNQEDQRAIEKFRSDFEKEIKTLLTEDQQEQFDVFQKQK